MPKKELAIIEDNPVCEIIPADSLNDQGLPRSDCKLCNSEFRNDAEQVYEQHGKVKRAFEFLINKGEQISYPAVRNHIIWHYNPQKRSIMLKEYANDIGKWLEIQKDRKLLIKRQIAALERHATMISIESEDLDLEHRIRSIDSEKKLRDSIVMYEKHIHEMESQIAPIMIFINEVNNIIRVELETVKNDETRQVLFAVVDKIQKQVQQLPE